MPEDCKHQMDPEWCSVCNGTEARLEQEAENERNRVLAFPGWFRAGYAGRCAECNFFFPSGTPVYRSDKGYVAMCCAPAGEPE